MIVQAQKRSVKIPVSAIRTVFGVVRAEDQLDSGDIVSFGSAIPYQNLKRKPAQVIAAGPEPLQVWCLWCYTSKQNICDPCPACKFYGSTTYLPKDKSVVYIEDYYPEDY